jgi:hypothetical protein
MKIINRLYIKVILIAVILSATAILLYFLNDKYQNDNKTKIDNLKAKYELKISKLEKKIKKQSLNKYNIPAKKPIVKIIKSEVKPKIKIVIKEIIKYKALEKDKQQINKLKIELNKKKTDINNLNKKIDKVLSLQIEEINHMQYENQTRIEELKLKLKSKFNKILLLNIHHQLEEELKMSPYLPTDQLLKIVQDRFVLENTHITVCIYPINEKNTNNLQLIDNRIKSTISDNRILEVIIDRK